MIATRREFLAAALSTRFARSGQAPSMDGARWRQASTAQPAAPPQPLGTRTPLKLGTDRDGFVYVPKDYTEQTALPLLVMLHGAGSTAQSVQYSLPLADEFGVIILAPDSRDERTWDGVLRSWGPDVDFIGEALQQTVNRYRVNLSQLGVGGFSDGASYALAFGISYGDQFKHVISMSPGVMQPIAARGKPRIFLSHGTNDPIMPIDLTSRQFVPKLKALGYDVTYREYEGRHTPSPPVVREAFQWFRN
jgi:phospholipase/carboxylesterase